MKMITSKQAKDISLEELKDRINIEEKMLETTKKIYQLRCEQENEWIRCGYLEAEQHRSRTLCGSLGLEGRWSDWIDGKPKKCRMNQQYQYRKANPKKNDTLDKTKD